MSASGEVSGPDFSNGIAANAVPAEGTLPGRVGDEPVLLSRLDGELFAVGGTCTHYGAALAKGLVTGASVRCPLHHACFDLRTGAALRAPALDPLDCWQVEVEGEMLFVRRKAEPPAAAVPRSPGSDRMVIVGGGAAGLACADQLRRLGHSGPIILLSADRHPPVDRPNLSKDFLAGSAPEEWLPLRPDDWYVDQRIDLRTGMEVMRIDPDAGTVHTAAGDDVAFDRLLLATGSEPNRLRSPGFDHDSVHMLRTLADARAISERATPGARAIIIGSSFIGLEAAAALRKRGLDVDVISPDQVPFQGVFGAELGGFLQALHEREGVRFHLGMVAAGFDGRFVTLSNGQRIAADLVLVGIGVKPRSALARSAGLPVDGDVTVDAFLETAIPGIFAAGDIAAYPDPLTGEPVRIEHWVTAERQGQIAAANMLGLRRRYDAVPFFWTEQFGFALRYVGHAAAWDESRVEGDIASGDFLIRYYDKGVHRASAGAGRDLQMLEEERRFEARIAEAFAGAEEPPAAPAIQSMS